MLVWEVQSWEKLPQNWKPCLKFEHFWRCCNDLNSFTGLLGSYCNAYFGLRVVESSCRSQCAELSFENGGWWWRCYISGSSVWITFMWYMYDFWMIEMENTRVVCVFGIQSQKWQVMGCLVQFMISGSLREFQGLWIRVWIAK